MNDAKPPCIEPTVGMQLAASTSRSRKFLMKREASFFTAGTPSIGGYVAATPSCKALIWASMPTCAAGRPGLPISMWMNFTPLAASRSLANLLISRIPAFPIQGRLLSLNTFCATSTVTMLFFMIYVEFFICKFHDFLGTSKV